MAHNLFLGAYSFRLKKRHKPDSSRISNNDFLSIAYPNKENAFAEGFAADFINIIHNKVFKTEENTHGGILEESKINKTKRYLDIMIDGGLTGITQFLIDEKGKKRQLPKDFIIGPKFFARLWIPGSSGTVYLFLQKYGSITIKPLFDSIIREVLKDKDFALVGNYIPATTTKQRQKYFMKHSTVKNIIITKGKSSSSTGAVDATSASIVLKNIVLKNPANKKPVTKRNIEYALKRLGINVENEPYEIKATYRLDTNEYREEKTTTVLDSSEETINIIPNILIKRDCIDKNNYPIFSEMQKMVDEEVTAFLNEI